MYHNLPLRKYIPYEVVGFFFNILNLNKYSTIWVSVVRCDPSPPPSKIHNIYSSEEFVFSKTRLTNNTAIGKEFGS